MPSAASSKEGSGSPFKRGFSPPLTVNDHPDHDTIATFRRRFLTEIEGLLVQVLLLAREAGMLKLGTVALDGTKVHANASRHSALSYEHAARIEAQLKAEVAELLALAEAADTADVPDGMSVPEELARREERLQRLAEAKAEDRGAGEGALRAGAGRVRGEDQGARGEGRGEGRKPARHVAATAGGRPRREGTRSI